MDKLKGKGSLQAGVSALCMSLVLGFSTGAVSTAQAQISQSLSISETLRVSEWYDWPVVGQAQLSWLMFDIYSSRLKTPRGEYLAGQDVTPHPLALEIDYQRDISAQQLLEATDDQWEKLGLSEDKRAQGIERLSQLFPDIQETNRLTYVTDGQKGALYFSTAQEMDLLGYVEQEWLNDAFLAIWLSPDTAYPELRQDLIGD